MKENEHKPEEKAPAKAPPERTAQTPGGSPAPAGSSVLGLQRSHGNQFVVRMLNSREKQVQRKCDCGGTCSKCSPQASGGAAVAAYLENPGSGKALPPGTRNAMESRMGQDFSQVRVHDDAEAGVAARSLGAQAFTSGKDVFFAPGRYRSEPSDPLLAHELVHVAQQNGGNGSGASHAALEDQAEQAEASVSVAGSVPVSSGPVGVQRKADDGAGTKTHPAKSSGPSFFERIGHGLASAGKAVLHGLEAAGSFALKGIQAIGHGIAAAADAVWTGLKWVGKQLWSKVTGIFERISHWVQRLPDRVGRLILGLWEGVKTMKPWALTWWESLGKASTWVDFLQWIGTRVVDLIEILGVGEAYETVMDFLKFNTRPLSGSERGKASSVFGGSINFELVRVDQHAVLGPGLSKNPRAYTSFHTINGWGGLDDATLIHELTHVWQYEQAGAIYMPQALHAQMSLGNKAYHYGGAAGLQVAKTGGQRLTSFNREQQAQIVEDLYLIKTTGAPLIEPGGPTDLPLYAHFVKEVSTLSESQLVS
ncbi:MAG: DUF4157 domain-containing protein [Bryobacteraceae bacterium]